MDDELGKSYKLSFEFSCSCAILNILIFTQFISSPICEYDVYEILHEKISVPMK